MLPRVRRALVLVLVLAWVPAAAALPPQVAVQAEPASGAAPLPVTLTASGDAASYRWDLGDGAAADGPVVRHVYAAGRFTATVTATEPDGETATAQTQVVAVGVSLAAPRRAVGYGHRLTLRGSVVPVGAGRVRLLRDGAPVAARARLRPNGSFGLTARIRAPGRYSAAVGEAASEPVPVLVKPQLRAGFAGSSAVGGSFALVARLRPASGGALRVRIWRGGTLTLDRTVAGKALRIPLDTRRPHAYRVRISTVPATGFVAVSRALAARVALPRLAYGARSSAVAVAARSLRALHYAAPRGSSMFDSELLDAVYAFQKVQGLPRTGALDAPTWAALREPRVPHARYAAPAAHLEVDKGRQVLFVVRGGRIALIVPVSTAGVPGTFTPVGRFAVYRKVVGFDPSPLGTLYDPLYFTGGYAIHGNPSVPPYPASHGCVRVPMWVAPALYASTPYGQVVYVY
jgi:PKD repeat protein